MKPKNVMYLLVVVLASCSLWQVLNEEAPPPRFPHKAHVVEQEMPCADCHEPSENRAGMPKLSRCFECHELTPAGEKPDNANVQELLTRLQAAGTEEPWEIQRFGDEVIFSHEAHAAKNIACARCHKGVEENQGTEPIAIPTMEDCISCHESYTKEVISPISCSQCHKKIRENTPPESHRQNWKYGHGDEIAIADEVTRDRCALCHGKDGCSQCHQAEKPRDHTRFWSRTGHGQEADIDRDRCALCHKEDFCVRCHEETAPRSHTGGWGPSQNLHCVNCHLPFTASNCIVCHKSVPNGHPQ